MGPSDSDVSRLLAGELPVDDPGLNEVAGFLTDLRHAYPPASIDGVRESHLAAVAEHARRQPDGPPPRRRRVARRRAVVVSVAALGVFTAGVGVAAAMGADPLAILPVLRPTPSAAPPSVPPVPTASQPGSSPSPFAPSRTPTGHPTTPAPDSGKPTPAPSPKSGGKDDPKSNNGKSDQAKAEHKPTAMPTQARNDKTDQPGKGRATQKPSPPANRGEADRGIRPAAAGGDRR